MPNPLTISIDSYLFVSSIKSLRWLGDSFAQSEISFFPGSTNGVAYRDYSQQSYLAASIVMQYKRLLLQDLARIEAAGQSLIDMDSALRTKMSSVFDSKGSLNTNPFNVR